MHTPENGFVFRYAFCGERPVVMFLKLRGLLHHGIISAQLGNLRGVEVCGENHFPFDSPFFLHDM